MDQPSGPNSEQTPSPDDLNHLEETISGKPLKQPAADALARMQRQLAIAKTDLQTITETNPSSILLPDIRKEIQDLTLRIHEYQHQLDQGKN